MRTRSILVIFFLLITAFIGVGVRCFYLQYFQYDEYCKSSLKQQANIIEKPRRGTILDCRGHILATSSMEETVFAEPRAIESLKATTTRLAQILNISQSEVFSRIANSKNPGYVKILPKIILTDQQRSKIRKIRGIGIEPEWQRSYPMSSAAAHVVGFTNIDGKGLAGVELKYDRQLHGKSGQSFFFTDAARRPIGVKQLADQLTDGADVVLTIDSAIQEFTYSALLKQYKAYQAESAVAIVVDPCSGGILSMVSLPEFDPENARSADTASLRNWALVAPFEPGSIFKPIVTACAIDTNSISRNETIFCENGNYHGKGFGRIGEYRRGFGDLKIREILKESSNIGMAKIGQKMGKEKIFNGVKLFGFGQKTGIDLPGENTGIVRPLAKWDGYSVARVPFGHEIMATAMQIVRAYCILANNGRVVQPYLVKAVVDNNGKRVKLKQPVATASYIIKPSVAKWMVTQPLVDVVKDGTGKKAALKKWQVWGKTGTANIAKANEPGYDEDNYVASFAGGAPAENPAVVILVSIRRPNKKLGKGYTGGTVAAPVAKEILSKTLNYLERL